MEEYFGYSIASSLVKGQGLIPDHLCYFAC